MPPKSSPGKRKEKKKKTSASSKTPVPAVLTVAALFKRQHQQQQQQQQQQDQYRYAGNKVDPPVAVCVSDDGDNSDAGEGRVSAYFSPSKFQTIPDVCGQREAREDELAGKEGPRRLSKRLSLRKASEAAAGREKSVGSKYIPPKTDSEGKRNNEEQLNSKFVPSKIDKNSDELHSKLLPRNASETSRGCDVKSRLSLKKSSKMARSGEGSVDLLNSDPVNIFAEESLLKCQQKTSSGNSSFETVLPGGMAESLHKQSELVETKEEVKCIFDTVDSEHLMDNKVQEGLHSKARLSLKRKSSLQNNPEGSAPKQLNMDCISAGMVKQSSDCSGAVELTDPVSLASVGQSDLASGLKHSEEVDLEHGATLSSGIKISQQTKLSLSPVNKAKIGKTEVADGGEVLEDSKSETAEPREDNKTENDEDLYRVPYYLENFNIIMKSVFEDAHNEKLFDDTDMKYVTTYNNLHESSQKLYVRLFSRKLAWLPRGKIKYPEIQEDLASCLQTLVSTGLLCSGEELEDLSVVFGALPAPDLRTLAKSYHVIPTAQNKGQIIQALITKSQQSTVASLFGQKVGAVRTAMLKKGKTMLGPLYQLCKEARAVFVRAMMLFSLTNTSGDDESGSGGQGQLFQMLMVNMGRFIYPTYTVNRQTQIFRCRQDLIRFEEALQLETELLGCTGSANWTGAYSAFLKVKDQYDQLVLNKDILKWDEGLPEFLRYYTAGSVLVRLLNQGIEILQRRKNYAAAVELIRQLLGQTVYNDDLHGYWWDRLALNLEVHLKQPLQALDSIEQGLGDPLVRTGHRLSLYLRAKSICSKPKSPFRARLNNFPHEPLIDWPETVVEGKVLSDPLPGQRYQFITEASLADAPSEGVTMCNVEQVVLDHYQANGYPQGVHAEGSVVSFFFCLYFWDVLFMDLGDAFHSAYQTSPLDLHTDAFYTRRQKSIQDRLAEIADGTDETLGSMLAETWDKYNGVSCAGINWDRFTSLKEAQDLVKCMGGRVLSGILGRYAEQPRHTRSGFPDLTLWNSDTKLLKICEVKGPGDRLSHKQMLWLDFLVKLGVDAEVCHVKPMGMKKLKPAVKK